MLAAIDGLHHVTSIASDAQATTDFYVGVLGLRLLKRSINQGNPEVYHLYYGAADGAPGATMTCFIYPRLPRGRPGHGQIARVRWRVGSVAALSFWADRVGALGRAPVEDVGSGGVSGTGAPDAVGVADPDGLVHELVVDPVADPPLRGGHPEIPDRFALLGLDGVVAFDSGAQSGSPRDATGLDALLGTGPGGELRGPTRGGTYVPVPPPTAGGRRGAGAVHHVAWTIPDEAYTAWQTRLTEGGVELVEVADRYYFRSLYFRVPSGVLFELATPTPGFDVDEPLGSLGTRLCIPPAFGDRAAELAASLAPFRDPLADWWSARPAGGVAEAG